MGLELVVMLKLLGLAAAAGLGTKLVLALMNKLPRVNAHTKSETLNRVVDALGNAAEDVLKATLSGGEVDALLTAMAGGTPAGLALKAILPALEAATVAAAGPAATGALTSLLGDQAAATRVTQSVLSAAHDLALAHRAAGAEPQPGQVASLLSGRILVVPHGQALPAGATLVAQYAAAA